MINGKNVCKDFLKKDEMYRGKCVSIYFFSELILLLFYWKIKVPYTRRIEVQYLFVLFDHVSAG